MLFLRLLTSSKDSLPDLSSGTRNRIKANVTMESKQNQVINSQRNRNISYVVGFVFILALLLPWMDL